MGVECHADSHSVATMSGSQKLPSDDWAGPLPDTDCQRGAKRQRSSDQVITPATISALGVLNPSDIVNALLQGDWSRDHGAKKSQLSIEQVQGLFMSMMVSGECRKMVSALMDRRDNRAFVGEGYNIRVNEKAVQNILGVRKLHELNLICMVLSMKMILCLMERGWISRGIRYKENDSKDLPAYRLEFDPEKVVSHGDQKIVATYMLERILALVLMPKLGKDAKGYPVVEEEFFSDLCVEVTLTGGWNGYECKATCSKRKNGVPDWMKLFVYQVETPGVVVITMDVTQPKGEDPRGTVAELARRYVIERHPYVLPHFPKDQALVVPPPPVAASAVSAPDIPMDDF